MKLSHFSAALITLSACQSSVDAPSQLAITVKPLTLAGITDARYRLRVEDRDRVLVFEREVTSSSMGDHAGAVSYVGPCDATKNPNYVTVEVVSLSDADGPLAANEWIAPPPVEKPATCVANGDAPVSFELTLARSAEQGFFDAAVALDDIFCSAKLDCGPSEADDLLLLHDGDVRATTAVLGFACAAGPEAEAETRLYLDHVQIDCEDGSHAVVPVDQTGNVDLTVAPADDGDGYLFGAAVYRATEGPIAFWNVSLGLARDRFASAGRCTLTALATASDGAFPGEGEAVLTPAGAIYPVIAWNAVLSDDGVKVCREHPLDHDAAVKTTYLHAQHRFGQAFAPSIGLVYGLPQLDMTTEEATGQVGAGQSSTILLTLADAGVPTNVPVGSGYVTLQSDNPGCVSVPASVALPAGAATVALPYTASAAPCATIIRASHPVYGEAAVPVSVVAAPDLGPLTITQNRPTGGRIGEGLAAPFTLHRLNIYDDESFELETSDPQTFTLASSPTGPGKTKIRLGMYASRSAGFWVRAAPGATSGSVTLIARHPRHDDGATTVSIVPVELAVQGLAERRSIHEAATLSNDYFQIAPGVTEAGELVAQHTTTALPIVIDVSGDPIGLLRMGGMLASTFGTTIPAGMNVSAGSGGLATAIDFDDPPELGSVTVSASLADHVVRASATTTITTLTNLITLDDASDTFELGLGLQKIIAIDLTGQHDDTVVHLTSSDPSRVRFSTNRNVAGTASIDLGFISTVYGRSVYVQTLPGDLADVELYASAPSFVDGVLPLAIVQPRLVLSDIDSARSGSTLSTLGDDPYRVMTAIPTDSGYSRQWVAPAFGDLTVTLSTDRSDLAVPINSAGGTTVTIPVGSDISPDTVATGGIANRFVTPSSSATLTTTASADGYTSTTATTTLTIATATASLANIAGTDDGRVGAGLAREMELRLSSTSPTPLTFRLTSDSKVRLATTNGSATTTLDVTVPANTSAIPIWLHGVTQGSTNVTIDCSGTCPIADAARTVTIVLPKVNLIGVSSSTIASPTVPAQPDAFQVEVGYLLVNGTFARQKVSGHTAGLAIPLSITNDTGLVFEGTGTQSQIYTLAPSLDVTPTNALKLVFGLTSGTHNYVVNAGDASFATGSANTQWRWIDLKLVFNTSVAAVNMVQARGISISLTNSANVTQYGNGATIQLAASNGAVGVATSSSGPFTSSASFVYSSSQHTRTFYIKGLAAGSSVLTASMVGDGATPASMTFNVDTNASLVTFDDQGDTDRIASGMQQLYKVRFGASTPAGTVLWLSSSDPSRVFFSTSATVAGSSVYSATMTTGTTQRDIYIQTMPGAPEQVELYASAGGYADSSAVISLEAGMLRFDNLTTARTGTEWADYPDDTFYVEGGVSNASATNGITLQYASPIAGPLQVTCSSSNPSVGYAYSNAGSTASIPVNAYRTPTSLAAGGFVHQNSSITSGSYTMSCSSSGFNPLSQAVTLTVTPVTVTMKAASGTNDNNVARGMQRQFTLSLSTAPPVSTTSFYVQPRDGNGAALTLASTTTTNAGMLELTYTTSQTARSFYVHGGPTTGDVTFDVWCGVGCPLPNKTFVVHNLTPRADVGALDINYTYTSLSPMPVDVINIGIGYTTTGDALVPLAASYVYGPLHIPVTLTNPYWVIVGGAENVVIPSGQSAQNSIYGAHIPDYGNGGTFTTTIAANGSGWDAKGTTDSRTVTIRQLALYFEDTTISRTALYETVDVYIKDVATGALVDTDGTVTIDFISGSFNGLSTDATTTQSSSATITYSGTETTEQVRVYGQNLPAGTQATLRATFNTAIPNGVFSADKTFTIAP